MFCALPLEAQANSSDRPTAATIDDTVLGWIWSGMDEDVDSLAYGGSVHTGGPGSYASYTFRGTSISVYCISGPSIRKRGKTHKAGSIRISLDGKQISETSLHTVDKRYNVCVYTSQPLSDSNHVLEVEPEFGWIDVNDITVNGSGGSVKAWQQSSTCSIITVKPVFDRILPTVPAYNLLPDGTVREADEYSGALATQNYVVDIPAIVGQTGYTGFTASSGEQAAIQTIQSWTRNL